MVQIDRVKVIKAFSAESGLTEPAAAQFVDAYFEPGRVPGSINKRVTLVDMNLNDETKHLAKLEKIVWKLRTEYTPAKSSQASVQGKTDVKDKKQEARPTARQQPASHDISPKAIKDKKSKQTGIPLSSVFGDQGPEQNGRVSQYELEYSKNKSTTRKPPAQSTLGLKRVDQPKEKPATEGMSITNSPAFGTILNHMKSKVPDKTVTSVSFMFSIKKGMAADVIALYDIDGISAKAADKISGMDDLEKTTDIFEYLGEQGRPRHRLNLAPTPDASKSRHKAVDK